MSDTDLFNGRFDSDRKHTRGTLCNQQMSSRQSLRAKFEAELFRGSEPSRSGNNWCDALSSFPNVNPKQALRNGAEKLSQTLYNVKTTFGVLSQKIKKSTKRRQPLINVDSPKSPVTPYTRSKAALGRTPTKLYSPFSIDTPKGKENVSYRVSKSKDSKGIKGCKSKQRRMKYDVNDVKETSNNSTAEVKMSNDLLQTQIGIYEFQSVANRIIESGFKN